MPLGNKPYLLSLQIPESHAHVRDWWEETLVSISLPSSAPAKSTNQDPDVTKESDPSGMTSSSSSGDEPVNLKTEPVQTSFKLTFTPGQHVANRGPFDRWKSLWGSWVVEQVHNEDKSEDGLRDSSIQPKKVYFAGDTGYRSFSEGQDIDLAPTCPAFREIGEKFGSFDLALIPIGYVQLWIGVTLIDQYVD